MPIIGSIRQIKAISRCGVFQNYAADAATPSFQGKNLIYGFNGSGKTTLSRIFACLGKGSISAPLPESILFEVELDNGTVIKSDGPLDQLKGHVLIFNTDYIEENFRWKDGSANPVFYLGKEKKDLSIQLELTQKELETMVPKRDELKDIERASEQAFQQFKRDSARLVGTEIGSARQYDATKLAQDYQRGVEASSLIQDETERNALRSLIAQSDPQSALSRIAWAISFSDLLRNTRVVLGTTLGKVAIGELNSHSEMLRWVKEGYDYHVKHDLSECLFCGGALNENRLKLISASVDSAFEKLQADITSCIQGLSNLRQAIQTTRISLPSPAELSPQLKTQFASERNQIESNLSLLEEILATATLLLQEKADFPNRTINAGEQFVSAALADREASLEGVVEALNTTIDLHNRIVSEFLTTKIQAKESLRNHYLAEGLEEYLKLQSQVTVANSIATAASHRVELLQSNLQKLSEQIRTHGLAAEMINKLLLQYLGHSELKLEANEGGYQIIRTNGELGVLSEGEKTALSLCYFLSSLEAEGRQLKDLIVVLDDPISSLDTKSLNYASSLQRRILESARQTFFLTHNLAFMNEIKKWLRNRKTPGDSPLFFLDLKRKQDGGLASCTIVKMPKLIREYESEYHYLFALVDSFAESDAAYDDYFYLMPNAMRKVLDVFLAFKEPGSGGLESKLDGLHSNYPDLDREKLNALERLTQLESHADNLDDLISMSSLTLEETKDASKALLLLIQSVDKIHFERMKKLCN